jgi:hypothetical protein
MSYLLDSNVFIQAKNLHYGFDFCPAFWEWLELNNEAGKVFSVEKVGDELAAGSDALAEWASTQGRGFFLAPDPSMLPALAHVSAWASSPKRIYEPAAVNTFLQIADYYLIAHALTHGSIVVSHEKPDNSKKRVKIPDVCIGLGVTCLNPYEMLRRERARFVLGSS